MIDGNLLRRVEGKLATWQEPNGIGGFGNRVAFNCPGCKTEHVLSSDAHSWNGDYHKPTFSPSVLVTWVKCSYDAAGAIIVNSGVSMVCHSFVNSGVIQFLGDCTHDLKNTSVQLPEMQQV